MKIRWVVVAVLWLLTANQAAAGWIIFFKEDNEQRTTRIQNNQLKFEAPDYATIFDAAKNQIVFIHPDVKTYWKGSPETFAASARLTAQDIQDMIAEKLEAAPPQAKKDMARNLRRQMLQQTGGPPPTVTVKPASSYETIAGHRAQKHEIHINGELRQELWIAESVKASAEFDVDQYGRMLRVLNSTLGSNEEIGFSDPKAISLLKKGWPLRTVTYDDEGYPDKTQAVEVIQKTLPATEFQPPSDYRALSSEEFFGQ